MDLFPEIEARTLTGEDRMLPADLPAKQTVVIAAFLQPQQELVDRWIDSLVEQGIPATPLGLEPSSDAALIELPVLPKRYRMIRGWIDGGMKRGIKLEPILARTWTAYTDVEKFREALNIPTPRVEVMVVTRLGEVIDRASGEPSEISVARIAATANAGLA
jgi:hypothetical protein